MTDQILIDFDKRLPSPCHGTDLDPKELLVLQLIRAGRSNARQARELAELIGEGEVTARRIVKHLVEWHGVFIVSATTPPAGYYRPQNEAECDAGVNQLIHRIRSLAFRLKKMKRQAYEQLFQTNFLETLNNDECHDK